MALVAELVAVSWDVVSVVSRVLQMLVMVSVLVVAQVVVFLLIEVTVVWLKLKVVLLMLDRMLLEATVWCSRNDAHRGGNQDDCDSELVHC